MEKVRFFHNHLNVVGSSHRPTAVFIRPKCFPVYLLNMLAQSAGAVEYTDCIWRCLWYNGYCRRKWTRRHEFKSWTRLIAFHIALIPLGKVSIQLFSLQLWVNSMADWVLQPW